MNEQAQESTETENQATSQETEDQDLKPVEGVDFDEGAEDPADLETSDEPDKDVKPDETSEQDKKPKPVKQEAVDKKINKLTWQKQEERRKRETAEAELAAAQAKVKAFTDRQAEVSVPEMPDPYDKDYVQKVARREDAIRKQEKVTTKRELAQQQEQNALIQQQTNLQTELKDMAGKMYEKGTEIGIDPTELNKADVRVAMFIRDPSLAKFILGQENSPLVIQYLAANAQTLEAIGRMDPVSAAGFIATNVLAEANKLMPEPSKTPAPVKIPKGKPVAEKESPFLKGVVME